MRKNFFALLLGTAWTAWTASATTLRKPSAAPLTLLTKEQSIDKGAVCLDGTAPGYYLDTASTTESSTKWVLYFKGGGWCYDEASCASRAKQSLGSNKFFPKTFGFGGPMDADPTNNPDFASFNRVVFWYCDGAR